MRAITEMELRDLYKKAPFNTYTLPAGSRLTPAASQFLNERRIRVLTEKKSQERDASGDAPQVFKVEKRHFHQDDFNGEKPEYMTHLNEGTLVSKNHPRIMFRGKIDSFEASLLCTIVEVEEMGFQELGRDLGNVLDYVRNILAAEVKDEMLPPLTFRGWSEKEIRERSHNPQKYFGVNHLLPDPTQGKLMVKLNWIRTQAREMELAAINAFYISVKQVEREDILQAVNRLSSLIYIIEVQLVSGYYRIGV